MRHEETDLNITGIISGHLDIGLNALGRINAKKTGDEIQKFNWTQIFSSPLKRCLETLELTLPKRIPDFIKRDELKERAMGDVEGLLKNAYTDLKQYQGIDLLHSYNLKANQGGESYSDVFDRLVPFIEELFLQLLKGERIFICSHEAPIRIMLMIIQAINQEVAIKQNIESGARYYFKMSGN